MAICLPGDTVPLNGARPGTGVCLLDGVTYQGSATTAGVVRRSGDEVFVENLRKRYIPRQGDLVIGIVSQRGAEAYKMDIRAPCSAYLPTLAFNGATKRNRPTLEVGSLALCRVEAAHPDLDIELSCIDHDTKKAWSTGEVILGELTGGLSFEVAISSAIRLQDDDCFVLDRLGKEFAYEMCTGLNGRVWVKAKNARETVLLLQAIRRSFGMSDAQVEVMVQKIVELFS